MIDSLANQTSGSVSILVEIIKKFFVTILPKSSMTNLTNPNTFPVVCYVLQSTLAKVVMSVVSVNNNTCTGC